MDEINIGDKIYVSSKRAAEITGYAKDYIGQLCREGRVDARLIGRNWYLLQESIRAHRFGGEVATHSKEGGVPAIDALWESPKYEPETRREIVESSPIAQELPAAPKSSEVLGEMHSAWNEWFSSRSAARTVEDAAAPEEMERGAASKEEVVPIATYRVDEKESDTEMQAEPVRLRKIAIAEPEPAHRQAIEAIAEQSQLLLAPKSPPSLALRLGLAAVALAFVVTALVGTGVLDTKSSGLSEAAALQAISGSRTYIK